MNKGQKGFYLIDFTMSIFIFSTSLLAFWQLKIWVQQKNVAQQLRLEAHLTMQAFIEGQRYVKKKIRYDTFSISSKWHAFTTYNLLSQIEESGANLWRITVKVNWRDPLGIEQKSILILDLKDSS